jgi:hypothetical protein
VTLRRSSLVIAALLTGALVPLSAQQPAQAPDTSVQGYAPEGPVPTPPSASVVPAAVPAPAAAVATTPVAPAAAAVAPSAAAVPASPTAGRSVAEVLGFIDVLPVRSPARIRDELVSAKAAEREADARLSEAEEHRGRTKGLIEVKKQEISTTNARIKLAERPTPSADAQKAVADKTTLEAEKKIGERQKVFLERRLALHDAEVDQAKASKRLAEKDIKALEIEQQLATRREDRGRVAGTDPSASLQQDEVIHELELKTLEAQRERAEAAKDVASRDQDIAKRRLDLYQAQMVASGSR